MSMFIFVTIVFLGVNSIYLKQKVNYWWNNTFPSFLWENIEYELTSGHPDFLGFQSLILAHAPCRLELCCRRRSPWTAVSPHPSPPSRGIFIYPTWCRQFHLPGHPPGSQVTPGLSVHVFSAWLLHWRKTPGDWGMFDLLASGSPGPPTAPGIKCLHCKYLWNAWIHFKNEKELAKLLF